MEEMGYALGAGALDTIDSPAFATLEPEEALIFRALQAGEYQERMVTERELEKLLEFYYQHTTDALLFKLMLQGDIFFAGFDYDDLPVFKSSPQGQNKVRTQTGELPSFLSEESLDGDAL